jgi:hypothetical protein
MAGLGFHGVCLALTAVMVRRIEKPDRDLQQRQLGNRVVRERSIVDVLDEVLGRGIVIQYPDEDRETPEQPSVVEDRPRWR